MTLLLYYVPSQAADHLPDIVILAIGGTIADSGQASTASASYESAKIPVNQLVEAVPELADIANVTGERVLQIPSEDFIDEQLVQLGKRVSLLLGSDNADGVVITHGTDTLEGTRFFSTSWCMQKNRLFWRVPCAHLRTCPLMGH